MTKQERLDLIARLEYIIQYAEKEAAKAKYYYVAEAGALKGAIQRLIWDLRQGEIYLNLNPQRDCYN